MKPLISILIATKNRQKYCLSAVESILMLPNKNIQVVVQDNSDNKNLERMLRPFICDSRLVYRYTPPPFSSIDNFNAAIELATGEYVCLIGDDDGINPEIIEATAWAKDNNVDCLAGSINVTYRWENTGAPDTLFTKMTGSTLTITHFHGKAKKVNIEDSFKKLMCNGCTNYLDFDFPKLYHGVVKKELLDEMKDHTGASLKGLSPDIYSAVALGCIAKNIVVIDYPLTIPGVCGQSTSITEGQIKKHSKKIEDAPHLRDRQVQYQWDENVPKIYCVQTIWADSAFAAIKEFQRLDLLQYFDKYMLCANILDADSSLSTMVYEYLKQNDSIIPDIIHEKAIRRAKFRGPFVKLLKVRVLGRLKKILRLERFETIHDVPDMVGATLVLESYLSKLHISLSQELDKV